MRFLLVSACLTLGFVSACSSPERSGYSAMAKHYNTSDTHGGGDDGVLVSLADSLAPLRDRFNADRGKPRLVALLSPT